MLLPHCSSACNYTALSSLPRASATAGGSWWRRWPEEQLPRSTRHAGSPAGGRRGALHGASAQVPPGPGGARGGGHDRTTLRQRHGPSQSQRLYLHLLILLPHSSSLST
ncbi:hypothetical protein HU200_034147 [Digitaria exilis]|uniref:Uncharacterized protein n=1 Tax=Digitaria exilis TaxID=1010633 RepID=A0A835EMG5_9POAL|nr:hypothetical protein HU200_034147 [Digitaria exilis]